LSELRLSDAGRPEEEKYAVGGVVILLERTFVEPQPFGYSLHRLFLPDDPLAELKLHLREPVSRVAIDHIFGNTRFLRYDVDDVFCADDELLGLVDLDLYGSRIQPPDRFIGEVEITDVFRRHLECGIDRLVRDRDRIILLEPRL